jgi:plasmid stabilization system protein ParE
VSYRIVWSDSALDRVTEFLDFIAEDNPSAAQRVIQNLFDWSKHSETAALRMKRGRFAVNGRLSR